MTSINHLEELCNQHDIIINEHNFPTFKKCRLLDIFYCVLKLNPINLEVIDQLIPHLDNDMLSMGLFEVAKTEDVSIIKYFIEKGADPHYTDIFGRNIMHFASHNSPEVIRYIYDLIGNSCFAKQESSKNAMLAVCSGKIENVKLLQQLVSDIITTDYQAVSLRKRDYDDFINKAIHRSEIANLLESNRDLLLKD
jgi:hypothetical protein